MNSFKDWTQADVDAFNAKRKKPKNEVPINLDTKQQPPKSEPVVRDGPLPALEVQENRAAHLLKLAQEMWKVSGSSVGLRASGKAKEEKKYLIWITDRRLTLIDDDNLCAKYIIDCLRYANLIPEDNPATCKSLVTQCLAERPEDVGIQIEIIEL